MLLAAFKDSIFPWLIQVGAILFIFSVCQHAYALYRNPNWQQFWDKFKAALFAYIIVRSSFIILAFIDNLCNNLK